MIEFNCPLLACKMVLLIHCMLVGHKIHIALSFYVPVHM